MSSTITSFALSVIGVACMVVAFKDGVVFDMRTLIIVFAGVAATTCSWMARIEASIDNLHVGEVRRNA